MELLYDLIGLIPIAIMVLSLIICLIYVFACLGLGLSNQSNEENKKEIKHCDKIMTISFIICILSMGSLIYYQNYAHTEKKLAYTINISAVEDTSQVHGGRYYISTDEYYKIIENNGDSKTQTKIPANYATIIEDGECKLYVYNQTTGNKIIDMLYKFYHKPTLYELHIPKNSVTDKYNIDLK